MKNKYLRLIISLFFIYSCGGGGGSAPFVLNVSNFNSFSVDEDETFQTVITASTDVEATITFTISSSPINASISIDNNGNLIFEPYSDFYGTDSFTIRVVATSLENGSKTSKNLNVNATVNSVNDAPTIRVTDNLNSFSNETLFVDDQISFNVIVSDVDNDVNELSVYGLIDGYTLSGVFNQSVSSSSTGIADINISAIDDAGLKTLGICISDGIDFSCGAEIEAYFVGNKQVKTIDYCDSSGNNCSSSDHYLYYLIGNENSEAKTNYLFVGDQLNGSQDRDDFHRALLSSINLLYSSDASELLDGYFNIIVLEEVALSGVSVFDIRTGCYSWDTNIYCIGEVDRGFMTDIVPNWTVTSFLTTQWGRGVAQGSVNIQPISSSSRDVVMHELGHSHGYMGDEYDSGGERTFAEWYGDWGINTTTVSNPNNVKWKHHIDFNYYLGIPGVDYDLCENYSDGSIHYRNKGLTYEDCECFFYQYQQDQYSGQNDDNSCKEKVGIFEGTYYGEDEDYRGNWRTIMWWGVREYGPINIDGFSIGSIMNQGFRNYSVNGIDGYGDLTNSQGLTDSITLSIDAVFDEDKLKVKWLIDGIEQPEHENKLNVTFSRPSDNKWVSYSYIVEDLTGNLFAENDPLIAYDFYEGNFERSYYYQSDSELTPIPSLMPYVGSFEWYDPNLGWRYDNSVNQSNIDDFLFAASCCSMGATFKINWTKYQQQSSQNNIDNPSNKIFKRPLKDIPEKVINLKLSKDQIQVNSINIEKPNPLLIKDPILRKDDIYALEFYNKNDELIYKLGIGNPFLVRAQHIGMEDEQHFNFEVPLKNFEIVIPNYINPSYVTLIKRNNENIYSEINRFILN